jgi:catalase
MSLLNLNQIPISELPKTRLVARFIAVGTIVLGIAGLFLYVGGWLTPKRLTPAAIIDTFEKVNGAHPGFRRNHAKGVCVSGWQSGQRGSERRSRAMAFKKTWKIGRCWVLL